MIARAISPLVVEPLLGLARAHARMTSLARLGIVYEIKPERPDPYLDPAPVGVHRPRVLTRNLGTAEYVDSIIMGGVDGEWLPVQLDAITADLPTQVEIRAHLPGSWLDVQA